MCGFCNSDIPEDAEQRWNRIQDVADNYNLHFLVELSQVLNHFLVPYLVPYLVRTPPKMYLLYPSFCS